jgi:O-acetylhomoserine (thiol)-lyase
MHDETIAIHGGYSGGSTRAVAVPIYQTVAHDFIDHEQAGEIFDLQTPGFHYNRINNPTCDVLDRRLALLEGGTAALVLSSGMAAVTAAVLNLLDTGDNLVATPQLYGASFTYFAHVLPRYGIEVRFAPDDSAAAIEPLLDEHTKGFFCESVGNPAGNMLDLDAVAAVVHAHGVPMIVDNTVPTPLLLKPIQHGADVVIHSLTKFIGGHGTTTGGAIVDGGTFPWNDYTERFPGLTQPEPAFHGVRYATDFPDAPFVTRCRTVAMRNTGPTLAPLNAFLFLQGLEDLAVRLKRHEANARVVAEHLSQHPEVAWVSFLGRSDNPYFELAQRYLGGHAPSIVTFGVRGGRDAAIRVYDSVKLFKRLMNMGDAKSLVAHPASTTHRQLTESELAQARVTPDMIRLSIGLEHPDDLIEDLDQALEAATAPLGVNGATAAVAGQGH